jgi:hypothetical protein
MPPAAAERAERELRELVEGKGLAFTPPSLPADWGLRRKLCVLGHFKTEGLHLGGIWWRVKDSWNPAHCPRRALRQDLSRYARHVKLKSTLL